MLEHLVYLSKKMLVFYVLLTMAQIPTARIFFCFYFLLIFPEKKKNF